jgi:hypothetical protein
LVRVMNFWHCVAWGFLPWAISAGGGNSPKYLDSVGFIRCA